MEESLTENSDIRPQPGQVLGDRYRLERPIGAGGMAQVWAGFDDVLQRPVAIKVMHSHLMDDTSAVQRFRQEAVAAGRLSHPGIVSIFDTYSNENVEVIVMELLEVPTLRQYLDEHGTIDPDTVTRLGIRLLEALQIAHQEGLVHRDIKPSNILICPDGRVKIADFGIAKAEDQTDLTQDGMLIGTASYLSPEQVQSRPVDQRSDVYSLGVVLYECLTGRVPFEGESHSARALARLHENPVDPRQISTEIPPRLAQVIMKALARHPEDRYQSSAAFQAALLDPTTSDQTQVIYDFNHEEISEEFDVHLEEEDVSFSRNERRWLFPALFILLIATSLTVVGLLYRETTQPAAPVSAEPAVVEEAEPPTPQPLALTAQTHDPQGDEVERDDLITRAVDGDPETAWESEPYYTPTFFGSKQGVGLLVALETPSDITSIEVLSSKNNWSGEIIVVDNVASSELLPDRFDEHAQYRESVESVTEDIQLNVNARGTHVLIWFTNLGTSVSRESFSDDRHLVQIFEVRVNGIPAQS